MPKHNILILSAGRRVELVRSFRDALTSSCFDGKILCGDVQPRLSSACVENEWAVVTPHARAPNYEASLLQLCAEHDIGMVVPTIDTELLPLARMRAAALAMGTHIIVADETLIAQCRDKRKTSSLFSSIDLPTPAIYPLNAIPLPCFTKPAGGSSSIGAMQITAAEQLTPDLLADPDRMFMELVGIGAREVTIDLYYDREHNLKCCVPRERMETRAGEVSKGVTRRDWIYDFLVARMHHIAGARGCLTLQLFADDAAQSVQAIEINPRFGGGFPLTYAAGSDYPAWLIAEYFGERSIAWYDQWEADLLMLRYDAAYFVSQFS